MLSYSKIFSSNVVKIISIIVISSITFYLWTLGLEKVYADILLAFTNTGLGFFEESTYIRLVESSGKNPYEFVVHTVVDGRKGSYPQEVGGLLQPFVIILSWQIFLFLVLSWKKAAISTLVNIGIYILIQMLFLVMLTNYYTSETSKYLYTMFLDSFYIIALILVIKDNMLYGVFTKSAK